MATRLGKMHQRRSGKRGQKLSTHRSATIKRTVTCACMSIDPDIKARVAAAKLVVLACMQLNQLGQILQQLQGRGYGEVPDGSHALSLGDWHRHQGVQADLLQAGAAPTSKQERVKEVWKFNKAATCRALALQAGKPQLPAAREASITPQFALCRSKRRCAKHSGAAILHVVQPDCSWQGDCLPARAWLAQRQLLHLLLRPRVPAAMRGSATHLLPLKRTHHGGKAFCNHSCLLQQPLLQLLGGLLRGNSSSRRLRRCCCCWPIRCILHRHIHSCASPAGSSNPCLRR